MDSIAEWLGRITWPLVSRALAALGLGTVTYTGASTALNSALDGSKMAFSGLVGEVAQLLAMAGFFDAMSITAGGLVSSLSWLILKKWAFQTTGQ